MEKSQQVRRFDGIPLPEEFASQIEQKNIPAYFRLKGFYWMYEGVESVFKMECVEWRPRLLGGKRRKEFEAKHELKYMKNMIECQSRWQNEVHASEKIVYYFILIPRLELGGSSIVEAMLSRSAPVFYGDIRSHERVPLPFSTFIGLCKDLLKSEDDHRESFGEESLKQIYLAQIPIKNTENDEKIQLACLRDDIEVPEFLGSKVMDSINLWMNNAKSRSSTHYDPHHNLLCVVSGCKQVVLWPPSACPFLYPLPVYGESSNHSAIPLESTNMSLFPRAKSIDEYSQKVTLQAGDALFIPEGWFHQVDSEDLSIAVNFWWRSDIMANMPEHMDAYYLRRILRRLIDKEMDQMLPMQSTTNANSVISASGQSSSGNNAGGSDEDMNLNHQKVCGQEKLEQGFSMHELEPHELKSLHELVSLVHERVNHQPAGKDPADLSVSSRLEDDTKKVVKTKVFNLEDDAIANIVWKLEPRAFQSIFITMAHNFPRTLEAFVLHALSPVGVEVLTRKFEQMDQRISPDERSQFYGKFYSVFDNQFSAMEVLLNGKESFACQAFNNVLVQYLGVNLDGPKPFLE